MQVSNDVLKKCLLVLAECGNNKEQAAQKLGIPISTFKGRVRRAIELGLDDDANKKEIVSIEGNENLKQITTVKHGIRTVEEALSEAKVSGSEWDVDKFVINKWDSYGRDDLFQVKVWLKRKVDKKVSDAINALIERAKQHAPKYESIKYKKVSDPHLLEISVFDAHFGKMAWGKETGSDYDLKIAEKIYEAAVGNLVQKAQSFNIDKILLPIGQDFFHIDNQRNTTFNDTPQDADGRYHKIFETGVMACVNAIDFLMTVAPVHILWVPGNHDRTTSYHLVRELSAWYNRCDNVSFNMAPNCRKYFKYGTNLIGFTHGDEEKTQMLPSLMADEVPDEWASTTCREWHLGHWHKKSKAFYRGEDSFGSVLIRTLPSLSGTDAWHYRKGYVKTSRAAEAYLWAKDNGYVGHFSSAK